MTSINNKEYLKKYLSIGKAPGEKKKKKKKQKGLSTRLKIVDDDILVNISEEIQHDLEGEAEDAPLIVSVIDDRPPSLRVDEESHTKLWKPIGSTDNDFNSKKSVKLEGSFKLNKPQSNILPPKTALKRLTSKKKDNDFSPSRIRIKEEKRFLSLDNSPPRSKSSSKDISPQRKIKQEVLSPTRTEDNSSPRRDKSDVSSSRERFNDISPLRKNKRDFLPLTTRDEDSDKDNSSPGKRERTEDISPPRKRVNDISPPRRNRRSISPSHRKNKREKNEDVSSLRKRDNDISPPRRNRRDISPSPPRKYKRDKSEDISPPRKTSINISPPRREMGDRETREQNNSPHREKKTRWGSENNKLSKTLEGKTAGLQNALDLAKETIKIKHKNDEMFKNMSVETSGKNAATVVRNFLRKKQKEVDPEEEEQKRITDEQNKEKYDRWGKGLKQVEAQNARMEDMAHEMSKPLARYADDMDLERHLKDQEREGDPMLAYMRKKKRKADVDSGKSIKPQFEGEFPPNRFGIPPGYRWDGVDRSTGYEKKYFEVQNKRKADIEEAYKWSTEDM